MEEVLNKQKAFSKSTKAKAKESRNKFSSTLDRSQRHIDDLKATEKTKLKRLEESNERLSTEIKKFIKDIDGGCTRNKSILAHGDRLRATSVRFNLTDNNW